VGNVIGQPEERLCRVGREKSMETSFEHRYIQIAGMREVHRTVWVVHRDAPVQNVHGVSLNSADAYLAAPPKWRWDTLKRLENISSMRTERPNLLGRVASQNWKHAGMEWCEDSWSR
jgi:hypothetical protein